jgi:hypothetical protein
VSTKIGRRGFLASALAAGALTQAGLLRSPKLAKAAAPMRALFVYVPDGCIPNLWHPTGSESAFSLPEMSAPLEVVKNQLVFLKGLDMYAGGGTHEGGIKKVLTATGKDSIDVFLGQKLQGNAPFASVQLGVAANFQNGGGSMSFVGGAEVKPDDNPLTAFERLFGGFGKADDPAAILARKRKQSVIDASLGDLQALQKKLGASEAEKIKTNLDAIREVEKRITSAATASGCSPAGWNAGGFAVSPNDHYPKTWEKEEHFGTVGKLQSDLAVLALGCDVTRSASIMWSHCVSPTKIPGLGVSMNNHDASHYGMPGSAAAQDFVKMKRWFAQRFAELVQALAARPYGGSTLLDHTLVLLCSELGDSNAHDHKSVPFVLAGGAAAGLRGGRFLDYSKTNKGENESHAKLLVSIARATGVTIDSFGYTGHGTGPLPRLFG